VDEIEGDELKMIYVRILVFLGLVSFIGYQAVAQKSGSQPAQKEYPADAYQIYQSKLTSKLVFRLNTYTGEVDQMQLNRNKKIVWAKLKVENRIKIKDPNVSRFQIYLSPVSQRDTLMLDKVTGKTWRFRKDSKGAQFWIDFGY